MQRRAHQDTNPRYHALNTIGVRALDRLSGNVPRFMFEAIAFGPWGTKTRLRRFMGTEIKSFMIGKTGRCTRKIVKIRR